MITACAGHSDPEADVVIVKHQDQKVSLARTFGVFLGSENILGRPKNKTVANSNRIPVT